MQIKPLQRTSSIGALYVPEAGKAVPQRKVAPIRDTYEDGSRRTDSFGSYFSGKRLDASSLRDEQNYRHNSTIDPHQFFLALLLQFSQLKKD